MRTRASDPTDQQIDAGPRRPAVTRAGAVVGLSIVAVLLATVAALFISTAGEDLPQVGGLDYRVVEVGLVLLVCAFCGYVWERERRIRALDEEVAARRVEAARMGATVESLHRDMERRREMLRLQQDLVSMVSHEVRGPLAAIKAFAGGLRIGADRMTAEDRRTFVEGIDQQADRLARLVEDLLEVQMIDSRALRIQEAELDLAELAREVVGHFSAQWGQRSIVVEAGEGLPVVRADRSKIDEVLVNLIDNAVKYSPDGGRVRVALAHGPRSVEISVTDDGIGIAPEEVPRLFQKFHRVPSARTREIGGTGLGLYIVKGLVEAHGGRVSVSSRVGVGSTFTVSLPLDRPPGPVPVPASGARA